MADDEKTSEEQDKQLQTDTPRDGNADPAGNTGESSGVPAAEGASEEVNQQDTDAAPAMEGENLPPPADTVPQESTGNQDENAASAEEASGEKKVDGEEQVASGENPDDAVVTDDKAAEGGVTGEAPTEGAPAAGEEGEKKAAEETPQDGGGAAAEENADEKSGQAAEKSEENTDNVAAQEEPAPAVAQEGGNVDANPETAAAEPAADNQGTDNTTGQDKAEEVPMTIGGEEAAPGGTTMADNGTGTEETGEKHEVDPHATSPLPMFPSNATATVKFVLMPSGHVSTMACALNQTVSSLREHFSAELRMPAEQLVFMFDGSSIDDTMSLVDLGVVPNGSVQLEISSSDPVAAPIKPPKPKPEYVMPDVITVRVERENGVIESIVVEIERSNRRKPFLGGYKHRLTSAEYHHAAAQTRPKARPDNGIEKFCRDTQTVKAKNMRQQTAIETSTQMTTIGCYTSNMTDRLVVPGRYTTAHEYHTMILGKVIILQSYFRRWQAKRQVAKLKVDLAKRLAWEREEEIRKIKEKEVRIKREFERRMNPRTKEDFDLLYHALEKWRQEELETIDASLAGAKRKAALCHLLEQETQLIASIGRHKLEADTENKQRAIQKFLDKAASPKRWRAYDGKYIEMDTAYTTRARELRDIYTSLTMKYLTQDERLDVLLTLKHTVKEHDCKLTQEIIELIDREADLLMRGVKEINLAGLRKRISTLFLQYIKTPTFNAEAAKLLKVPQDPSSLRKNIHFCQSCNSYLPSTEFQLSSNSKVIGKCRRCTKLDNDARTRQDFSHYRYMLRSLRKTEENMQDGSRIAFLLQEADLRYLVENIWATQSSLSAWTDLYDLVLVRWDKDEEWSPWNCILLTKDEAQAHSRIDNLEAGYGRVFSHKIHTKHTLARNYFSRLPGMSEHMRTQATQLKPGNSIATKPAMALTKA